MLRDKLAALGSPLTGAVELSAGTLGDIEARANSQDAETALDALRHDPELSAAFHRLVSAISPASATQRATVTVDESGVKLGIAGF